MKGLRGFSLLLILGLFFFSFVSSESFLAGGSAFVVTSGGVGITCNFTSDMADWKNSSSGQIFSVYANGDNVFGGNCSLYSSFGLGGCCPAGFACNLSTGECSPSNSPVVAGCSEYSSEVFCNLYNPQVAIASLESTNGVGICGVEVRDGECSNVTVCACTWNSTLKSCSSTRDLVSMCFNSDEVTHNSCNWVQTGLENLCDSQGKIKVTYSASGNALGVQDWCEDTIKEYPCSASLKLPFFTWFNLVLSILVIGMIYFIISRKK